MSDLSASAWADRPDFEDLVDGLVHDPDREPVHQHNRRWWASYVAPVAHRVYLTLRRGGHRLRKDAALKNLLSPADIARVVDVFRVLDRWYKEQGQ